MSLLNLTPEDAIRGDWLFVLSTLKDCQKRLQSGGVRHSWIDPAIEIAQSHADSSSLETRAVPEICAKPLEGVDAGDLCERQEGHTGNCGLDPI